ncbi:MAG: hypothetical protein M3O34_00445 [Chloroflexota bacterium]|nr:hypothetical protein [Chloroflexota bacterium]
MPIGAAHYPRSLVSSVQQAALGEAVIDLIDDFADDLAALKQGQAFADLAMADFLPRAFGPRYDESFARRFFVTLMVVAWKLRSPDDHPLANLAEQLAFHAIVDRAEMILDEWGEDAPLTQLFPVACERTEFLTLYDPRLDQLKPSEARRRFYGTPLDFPKWFEPFGGRGQPHPYTRHRAG